MTEHEGDARARSADGRRAGLAILAFGWVFACGFVWVSSGVRHLPEGAFTKSFAIGFLAAAPAAALALVLFFRLCVALVRGQPLSFTKLLALGASGGAVFGAAMMDLVLWSMFLDRVYPSFFAHGRRLHRRGELLAPRTSEGTAWLGGGLELREVPDDVRAGVAAQWRENAGKEHASVAAFAQLSLDLVALGAPPSLVAASHEDALDEVRHAEACYGVACALDGLARGPAPFPEARAHRPLPRLRDAALASVAVDALADGALNEGIASRLLARLASRAASSELASLLRGMAADEARHASHSWEVIAWCLAEGGPLVRAALVRAGEEMPASLGSPLPEAAREGAWERWGVQGVALEVAEYAVVRRLAQKKLASLLARELEAA